MNFLKKLIENVGKTEEVVTEASKLEFPDYSRKVGDFVLSLAGVYQNARGDIDEVFVTATTPDGRKFRIETPLPTPVRDSYDARQVDFSPTDMAVWGDQSSEEDEEMSQMLSAIAAQFLNDVFADAAKDAYDNQYALDNPRKRTPGYGRSGNDLDYD